MEYKKMKHRFFRFLDSLRKKLDDSRNMVTFPNSFISMFHEISDEVSQDVFSVQTDETKYKPTVLSYIIFVSFLTFLIFIV